MLEREFNQKLLPPGIKDVTLVLKTNYTCLTWVLPPPQCYFHSKWQVSPGRVVLTFTFAIVTFEFQQSYINVSMKLLPSGNNVTSSLGTMVSVVKCYPKASLDLPLTFVIVTVVLKRCYINKSTELLSAFYSDSLW